MYLEIDTLCYFVRVADFYMVLQGCVAYFGPRFHKDMALFTHYDSSGEQLFRNVLDKQGQQREPLQCPLTPKT